MISRRQLRVKAMQLLYEFEINSGKDITYYQKRLRHQVNEIHELFIYHLYVLYNICLYVNKFQDIQERKLLEEDKQQVSKKLLDNTYFKILDNSAYFKKKVEQYKLREKLDDELIKSAFYDLIKRKIYRKYLNSEEPSVAKDNLVFQEMYLEILLEGDFFDSVCELNFQCWNDDYNLVCGYVIGFLKNAPNQPNYLESLDNEVDEEDIVFGEQLLQKCIDYKDDFKNSISKVLDNWDLERVGSVERILLYMTMAEMQFFEIPDKVTINEYIEIAKIYGSEKSHEFINGIIEKLITQNQITLDS